ncbi:SMI1/KNR4 family protein [Dictyobacter kobayashii]|uniref:Knr4/Smi1-like domain-containing protein n=1 Tax=Dictyobacter kobayashii TaxID=2014872 RepID=A0A402AVQ5_9CHLR|nr:SMI1/KNR4 family protein [Dictyobacter kobayashii]GCE23201.1 hypothetical protein KDK_70010 [Dictyobacter kobayashii]
MYLDHVIKRATSVPYFSPNEFIPCTIDEVLALEQFLGSPLPRAYREFLLWMGHSGGKFLQGTDCFYSDLFLIQEGAKELLEEDKFSGQLPENAFVFYMHQGYQFQFFLLNEEDPPVYFYLEERPIRTSFVKLYSSFSEFLSIELEGHIKSEAYRIFPS